MTTQHTPGPWEVEEILSAGRVVGIRGIRTASEDNLVTIPGSHCVSYTRTVAEIPWGDTLSNPAHLADARLMAGSPNLLAALEASNSLLLAERAVLYQSYAGPDGEIDDPIDAQHLKEWNDTIAQNQSAISKAKGK